MSIKNILTAIVLLPLLLGGAIALAFLSYMAVPLIVMLTLGTIIYLFISEGPAYEEVPD